MMDEMDLNKKINELKKAIDKDDMKKSVLLLTVILTSLAILAGGLLLGTIFGHMGLCLLTSVLFCVPVNSGNVVQIGELRDVIKRSYEQIEAYKSDIDNLRALRIQEYEKQHAKNVANETKKNKYEFKKGSSKKIL